MRKDQASKLREMVPSIPESDTFERFIEKNQEKYIGELFDALSGKFVSTPGIDFERVKEAIINQFKECPEILSSIYLECTDDHNGDNDADYQEHCEKAESDNDDLNESVIGLHEEYNANVGVN